MKIYRPCRTFGGIYPIAIGLHPILSYITLSGFSVIFSNSPFLVFRRTDVVLALCLSSKTVAGIARFTILAKRFSSPMMTETFRHSFGTW